MMNSPAHANPTQDESTAADRAARGGKRWRLRFSLRSMLLAIDTIDKGQASFGRSQMPRDLCLSFSLEVS